MPARTLADDDGAAGDGDWAMATRTELGTGTGGNLTEVADADNATSQPIPRRAKRANSVTTERMVETRIAAVERST
jgi:hypothetical protein